MDTQTAVDVLLAEHLQHVLAFREAREALFHAFGERKTPRSEPVAQEVSDLYEQTAQVVQRSFGHLTTVAPIGAELEGVDGILTLVSRVAGEVVLTDDGGSYVAGWHEGSSVGSARVERWDAGRRVFHGYVDLDTRRLTQTG